MEWQRPLDEWNSGDTWKDNGWQRYELDLKTWVFEEESFVPMALLLNGKAYSIVTDQLGTPTEAYNAEGEEVWSRRLDMNGNILEEKYNQYAPYSEQIWIPFLFQGQYYDHEIELAYNRFRYYSPELGRYISEDPIRLNSGTTALHSYVEDTCSWVDVLGLAKSYDADAKSLGYTKTNMKSHGQPVFCRNDKLKGQKKPKRKNSPKYITPDVDSHNGGVWKGGNTIESLSSKQTRLGTYDVELGRIGD